DAQENFRAEGTGEAGEAVRDGAWDLRAGAERTAGRRLLFDAGLDQLQAYFADANVRCDRYAERRRERDRRDARQRVVQGKSCLAKSEMRVRRPAGSAAAAAHRL